MLVLMERNENLLGTQQLRHSNETHKLPMGCAKAPAPLPPKTAEGECMALDLRSSALYIAMEYIKILLAFSSLDILELQYKERFQ